MQTPRTLRLTESQYATIIGHCYDGLPDEACGLLVGPLGGNGEPSGAVSEARPCRNADASAVTYGKFTSVCCKDSATCRQSVA